LSKKAIVVVGPTASGKTSLGIYIAKKYNGEVISADSMQIYKEMSVSTAKPTIEEMDGVKHHLIDFVDITDTYSVSDYCRDAKAVFDDIVSRGKLPVIVGGTGLYIDSFITNTQFFDDAQSDEIRKRLQKQANDEGLDVLYNRLKEIDPDAAAKIHPNNSVRVIRALEVYEATGKTITQQSEQSHSVASDIDALYIGINYSDREKLYDRINRRVDIMMENGLLDEAKSLFSGKYSATAVNSIGCKEMKPFLDGEKSLSECVEKLKMSTRHYAKRQLTWFRRNESVKWVYPDKQNEDELYSQIVEYINDFLKE
jgi:tRNA dimethylallyltransferase